MTDKTAPDTEPTDLAMALIKLRHARAEVSRLTPFVAVADGASRAAEHWERAAGKSSRLYAAAENQRDDARAERDGAYRERAQLLAWLAALHPTTAVIAPAPDVDEGGWQILYLVAGGWQMSWHIAPRDAELFTRVEHVPVDDPRAKWDGHTTDQKYTRIRSHTRLLAMATDGKSTQAEATKGQS